MTGDAELQRTLATLRAQYLAEAPGRIAALAAAVERIAAGDVAAVAELRQLLHRLAGSGGAYGLQEVTDAARAGEGAVRALEGRAAPPGPLDARMLEGHVAAVAAAFRQAGAGS